MSMPSFLVLVNTTAYLENTEVGLLRLLSDTLDVASVLWSARGRACVAHQQLVTTTSLALLGAHAAIAR